MLNIHRPKPGDEALYHLTSANRTIVGGRLMEFVQQKVVRMKMIGEDKGDTIYEYQLLAQQLEGTAVIHEWAMDMEILQSPLKIVLDEAGQLKDIRNLFEIREKWETSYVTHLRRKYKHMKEGLEELIAATDALLKDKPRFLQSLQGYSGWRFFFQDNFDGQPGSHQQHLLLHGFFGQVDLPLSVEATWTEEYGIGEYSCQLETKGKLDESKFDRKMFARMLKDLTGMFNVSAQLDVSMEEQLQYDKQHWLLAGELYLETKVADWYSVASAHVLERIDTARADELKKNFNVAAAPTA
ncbi:hypothetical protein CLV59_101847 [Chitinophaga dinghuensis]|uniref:Uncharacterized protein n=1 Tax=Chitinophaga dinghuensis TaxID=1539050 RepID=A0A327WDU5_9BACT|nr:hypothetical protein [Chitinophaga dinghuensis]RAJ88082.1 hypothetical protein CLV59_101847 [Chitinophaga dinghuensis]